MGEHEPGGFPCGALDGGPAGAGGSTAAPALPGSGYSGRLTGQVRLDPGTYRFSAAVPTNGDDGVRMFLDDQPVLDRWDTVKAAATSEWPSGYWRLGDVAGLGR